MTSVRVFLAIAFGLALVLLVWSLSSCEPCAVVLTGHCEERQHDEDKATAPVYMPPGEPAPLYVPHSRG